LGPHVRPNLALVELQRRALQHDALSALNDIAMNCKPHDWIEHSAFGLGRVNEDRGDRLDIDFITSGAKTILKTAELKSALSPPDFKFPSDKAKARTPRFKVERPPRPPLDFDHLVGSFLRFFQGGFDSEDFENRERHYKAEAARLLRTDLSRDRFDTLLRNRDHTGVCAIAKKVLQSTNLVFRVDKAKFGDAVDNVTNHERFANALYELLYGSTEMEEHFTKFCDVLSEMGANEWTIATYYQFLASNGKWMFMKPSIMKRMADSLKIALNYKREPNWLTYSKLQELADRVDMELQKRKLTPHSRIDVQGFIWTSIQIEEGKYGKSE
jgi:hypothetical protein